MSSKGSSWHLGMKPDDAHNWALTAMCKKKLPYANREMAALAEYKNGDYQSINASQRHATKMQAADPYRYTWACRHADALETLISRQSTPCDLTLYRGFHSEFYHHQFAQGQFDSFIDLGFTSTSLSKHVGHNSFTDPMKPYAVKCDIVVRQGMRAAYVEQAKFDYQGYSGEAEILLQRGIMFLVTAATLTNGVLTLDLEAKKL